VSENLFVVLGSRELVPGSDALKVIEFNADWMQTSPARLPVVRRNSSVVVFVVVSFAWTWAIELIARSRVTATPALEDLGPWLIVASFGPTVGALVVAAREYGRSGPRILFSRFGSLRQNWRIWLYASYVLVPVALIALVVFSPGHAGAALGEGALLVFVPIVGLVSILTGPLGEEFGWRGVLLPAMLERVSPLVAAFVVGVVWSLWHAPLWTFSDFNVGLGVATFVPLYIASLIAMSIVMTVLHLRSVGSVFFAMLAHGVLNSVVLPFEALNEKQYLRAQTAWPFTGTIVTTAVVVAYANRSVLRSVAIMSR
jgi:uncharacterized protein